MDPVTSKSSLCSMAAARLESLTGAQLISESEDALLAWLDTHSAHAVTSLPPSTPKASAMLRRSDAAVPSMAFDLISTMQVQDVWKTETTPIRRWLGPKGDRAWMALDAGVEVHTLMVKTPDDTTHAFEVLRLDGAHTSLVAVRAESKEASYPTSAAVALIPAVVEFFLGLVLPSTAAAALAIDVGDGIGRIWSYKHEVQRVALPEIRWDPSLSKLRGSREWKTYLMNEWLLSHMFVRGRSTMNGMVPNPKDGTRQLVVNEVVQLMPFHMHAQGLNVPHSGKAVEELASGIHMWGDTTPVFLFVIDTPTLCPLFTFRHQHAE